MLYSHYFSQELQVVAHEVLQAAFVVMMSHVPFKSVTARQRRTRRSGQERQAGMKVSAIQCVARPQKARLVLASCEVKNAYASILPTCPRSSARVQGLFNY